MNRIFSGVQPTGDLHLGNARTAFLASPGKYLPAAGGQDVVSLGSQRPQPGSLDHATWHRGQLYLFASPENLATFTKQPDRYSR